MSTEGFLRISNAPVDRTIEPVNGILIDLDVDGNAVAVEVVALLGTGWYCRILSSPVPVW